MFCPHVGKYKACPRHHEYNVRMKEMEGYEADEIMAITGCTSESLRQNLSRARRRIREEFIRITTSRVL